MPRQGRRLRRIAVEKAFVNKNTARDPFAWWLVLPVIPIVAYSLFQSLCDYREARSLRATALERMQACRQASTRLLEEISCLRSDRLYIERVAREQFGYTRPGEIRISLHRVNYSGSHSASARATSAASYLGVLRGRLIRVRPLLIAGLLIFAAALALDMAFRHWENREQLGSLPQLATATVRERKKVI